MKIHIFYHFIQFTMSKGEALPKLAVRRISLSAKPKKSHCNAIYHTLKAYIAVSKANLSFSVPAIGAYALFGQTDCFDKTFYALVTEGCELELLADDFAQLLASFG